MVIYIGADHRGFQLKEYLKRFLGEAGYPLEDVGAAALDTMDDYVDYAAKVAERVSRDYDTTRGIVLCASGVGADMVANKFANVRAALVHSTNQAFDSRNDDDSNVLALAAEYLEPEAAKKIVLTWLQTPFSEEERHRRRLLKITQLEERLAQPNEEDKPSERYGNRGYAP